ncbi:TetR/AcrR family transcriptional regulator [Mycobacterium sp. Aquia_213]|uniref:TetR/AcrR family transcriptional regulator n=1 Tax=Mycobacterium sp. Aquia_213 TaxID=2991728 RepID=UPI00226FFFDC|nr:TetR/AcrR family transcriptional regulator [Mycobacterium sp. Aquia_213]WAC93795.1 TetR/AcrR family transcriptional regulator [Mycobacterium sp. Aquia_213]
MAKPLIPAEDILTHALDLLDSEGIEALSVRRLSAALKISPRTLYQQVGNREALIRALVARHFAQLKLDFKEYDTWESTALHWCQALHDTLRAHPFLTELMTIDDRSAVTEYVNALLKATLQEGIPRPLATECCRGLAHMTINHSIVDVRGLREAKRSESETAKIEQNFPRLVEWVISGVRAEAGGVDAKTNRSR